MTTYTVAPSARNMTNANTRRGSWNTTRNTAISVCKDDNKTLLTKKGIGFIRIKA